MTRANKVYEEADLDRWPYRALVGWARAVLGEVRSCCAVDYHHTRPWEWVQQLLVVRPRAGTRVLDVGCGKGLVPFLLRELGCEVECVDPTPPPADWRDALAAAGGRFTTASAFELPFPDRHFDAVVSTCVLEHVANWGPEPSVEEPFLDANARALRETGRVLAAGGLSVHTVDFHGPGGTYYRAPHLREIARRSGLALVDEPAWDMPDDLGHQVSNPTAHPRGSDDWARERAGLLAGTVPVNCTRACLALRRT